MSDFGRRRAWDWTCLSLFAAAVASILVLVLVLHRHAASLEGIDRASHDQVVAQLKAQLDAQQDAFDVERKELCAAIGALAIVCGLLYRNSRGDAKSTRSLICDLRRVLESYPPVDGPAAKKKEAERSTADPAVRAS